MIDFGAYGRSELVRKAKENDDSSHRLDAARGRASCPMLGRHVAPLIFNKRSRHRSSRWSFLRSNPPPAECTIRFHPTPMLATTPTVPVLICRVGLGPCSLGVSVPDTYLFHIFSAFFASPNRNGPDTQSSHHQRRCSWQRCQRARLSRKQ